MASRMEIKKKNCYGSTDSMDVGMEDGAATGLGPFSPFGLLFWGYLGDLGELDLGFLVLGLEYPCSL